MLPFSLFSHLTECPNLRNEISASDLIRHYIWPWHHCCRHTNLLVPTLFHLYWFQSISRRPWIVTCEWCWLYVYVNKDSPQKAPKMIIRYNIISIKDHHHLFKHPSLSTKQILQTSLHIVSCWSDIFAHLYFAAPQDFFQTTCLCCLGHTSWLRWNFGCHVTVIFGMVKIPQTEVKLDKIYFFLI